MLFSEHPKRSNSGSSAGTVTVGFVRELTEGTGVGGESTIEGETSGVMVGDAGGVMSLRDVGGEVLRAASDNPS